MRFIFEEINCWKTAYAVLLYGTKGPGPTKNFLIDAWEVAYYQKLLQSLNTSLSHWSDGEKKKLAEKTNMKKKRRKWITNVNFEMKK